MSLASTSVAASSAGTVVEELLQETVLRLLLSLLALMGWEKRPLSEEPLPRELSLGEDILEKVSNGGVRTLGSGRDGKRLV